MPDAKKARVLIYLLIGFSEASVIASVQAEAPEIRSASIVTERRLDLTRQYARHHYGTDTYELANPRMIVIHYTAVGNLADSLRAFRPETIAPDRGELAPFGAVNVGAHYLVDKDGTVYRLLPDDVMGRHVIGFNHCAIGIENVARDARELTADQERSNVALVKYLIEKHPTILYLTGHHEAADKTAPHASLYKALDPRYRPTRKADPGDRFMTTLRKGLEREGVSLER